MYGQRLRGEQHQL